MLNLLLRRGRNTVIRDRHPESKYFQFPLDLGQAAALTSVQLSRRIIYACDGVSDLVKKLMKFPNGLQIVQLNFSAPQDTCNRTGQIIGAYHNQLPPRRNAGGVSAIDNVLQNILWIVKQLECRDHFAGIASQQCQLSPQCQAVGIAIRCALILRVAQLNPKKRDTAANRNNRTNRLYPTCHEIRLIWACPESCRTGVRYDQDRDHSAHHRSNPLPWLHI